MDAVFHNSYVTLHFCLIIIIIIITTTTTTTTTTTIISFKVGHHGLFGFRILTSEIYESV